MGNSASSLPFSIGKQVSTVNHGWALHEGSRKSDNLAVSVFVAKKPPLAKTPIDRTSRAQFTQLGAAVHHYGYSKRLRHPHILQVLATLDTDNPTETADPQAASAASPSHAPSKETGDLIIVTEQCMPLEEWLQTASPKPTLEQLAWGLESVVRALHFLHSSANLAHGNVSPSSLYVTRSGDVKLWNFAIVTPVTEGLSLHFKDYESLVTPQSFRSPERIGSRWSEIVPSGVHTMDSYSVGVLIPFLFGGTTPQLLQKAVQRMQTTNIKMRPRVQPLLKCPIFNTPLQKLQLQLEELAVQPVEQKISFWHNLASQLQGGVPENLAQYKLLPLIQASIRTIADSESLRAQDLYRRELLALLQPFFFILERHTGGGGTEITKLDPGNVEAIASLFRVNDRGIRGALLQKVQYLSQVLEANPLNSSVFEPMCSGFSDSSAALRELTLKAALGLVPKLTQPNLEKLARYLVRLQSDPEPSIRTNTVIFFSKLASYLTETTRNKMLLPAFVRALKDPFTPCRLSALKSVVQGKQFFTPTEIASSVLPVVAPQLLDPVAEVRREAFTVVDDLLYVLRQESERMSLQVPVEGVGGITTANGIGASPTSGPNPQLNPPSVVAPAPASGGYLSGLSSWVTSSAKPSTETPHPSGPPPPQPVHVAAPPPVMMSAAPPQVSGMNLTTNSMAVMQVADEFDDDNDGWGDDDDDDDLLGDSSRSGSKSRLPPAAGMMAPPAASAMMMTGGVGSSLLAPATEDDFFGTFDSKPARPVAAAAGGGIHARKGKLVVPSSKSLTTPKPKPAVTKLVVDDDPVGDAWDDF